MGAMTTEGSGFTGPQPLDSFEQIQRQIAHMGNWQPFHSLAEVKEYVSHVSKKIVQVRNRNKAILNYVRLIEAHRLNENYVRDKARTPPVDLEQAEQEGDFTPEAVAAAAVVILQLCGEERSTTAWARRVAREVLEAARRSS